MQQADFQRAIQFIHREGRILERRIADAVFGDVGPEPVVAALASYRNADGGFGWGLEPDKSIAASQPLDVEFAWESIDWVVGIGDRSVEQACDYLAAIGPGVSCTTADATNHPHAAHWGFATQEPALNPTAGLVGFLWKWEVDHPWRAVATDFCWGQIDAGAPVEAHGAIRVLRFLEHVPDSDRAVAAANRLRDGFPTMEWLQYSPEPDGYGVSPLQLVSTPDSPWRDLFPAGIIEGHLDLMEGSQADDGGWNIAWEAIGPAAVSAWRGRNTLENLLILTAYGRV